MKEGTIMKISNKTLNTAVTGKNIKKSDKVNKEPKDTITLGEAKSDESFIMAKDLKSLKSGYYSSNYDYGYSDYDSDYEYDYGKKEKGELDVTIPACVALGAAGGYKVFGVGPMGAFMGGMVGFSVGLIIKRITG